MKYTLSSIIVTLCLAGAATAAFATTYTPEPNVSPTAKNTTKEKVLIVMGSLTDKPVMEEAQKWLNWFGITNDLMITSVHRTPEKVREVISAAKGDGYNVIIAGAGMAAHLPGMCSAYTTLPVLGVPLEGGLPGGVDALYSVVQMPAGLPVGTLAVGRAGARNSAVMAARILALNNPTIAKRLELFKQNGYKIE